MKKESMFLSYHSRKCMVMGCMENFQYFRKAFSFPRFVLKCMPLAVVLVGAAARGVLREARGTQGPSHTKGQWLQRDMFFFHHALRRRLLRL